ncbi:hypothetical protein HDU98_002235, partial [Podochytrium sp. JEL0797]
MDSLPTVPQQTAASKQVEVEAQDPEKVKATDTNKRKVAFVIWAIKYGPWLNCSLLVMSAASTFSTPYTDPAVRSVFLKVTIAACCLSFVFAIALIYVNLKLGKERMAALEGHPPPLEPDAACTPVDEESQDSIKRKKKFAYLER